MFDLESLIQRNKELEKEVETLKTKVAQLYRQLEAYSVYQRRAYEDQRDYLPYHEEDDYRS